MANVKVSSVFNFCDSSIEVLNGEGELLFRASHLASALEYTRTDKMLCILEDRDDAPLRDIIDTLGRVQKVPFLTEPQLYEVLARTDKPKAKPFKKWLFSEVLPSIRKTGSYNTPDKQAIAELVEQNNALYQKIEDFKKDSRLTGSEIMAIEQKIREMYLSNGRNVKIIGYLKGKLKGIFLNSVFADIQVPVSSFTYKDISSKHFDDIIAFLNRVAKEWKEERALHFSLMG